MFLKCEFVIHLLIMMMQGKRKMLTYINCCIRPWCAN